MVPKNGFGTTHLHSFYLLTKMMHLVEYGLLKILESTIDHFEVGKFKETLIWGHHMMQQYILIMLFVTRCSKFQQINVNNVLPKIE